MKFQSKTGALNAPASPTTTKPATQKSPKKAVGKKAEVTGKLGRIVALLIRPIYIQKLMNSDCHAASRGNSRLIFSISEMAGRAPPEWLGD